MDTSKINPEIKIFTPTDETWELLSNASAEVTLTPVDGQENTYAVQFTSFPEEALKEGTINFVHVSLAPSEKGFLMPEWVCDWNMLNVDVDLANFDGSKTINLIHVIGSLKDSIFSTEHPSLVDLNFVVDCR